MSTGKLITLKNTINSGIVETRTPYVGLYHFFINVANKIYVLKKNNKLHCKTVINNGIREIKR